MNKRTSTSNVADPGTCDYTITGGQAVCTGDGANEGYYCPPIAHSEDIPEGSGENDTFTVSAKELNDEPS